MKKDKVLKKGGIDTILAYVVVSIPLFYVLIFMIATLYHFSIQMHINQTLKETLIMASSYGQLTDGMIEYLFENLTNVGDENTTWGMNIGLRKLDSNGDVVNWNNVVGGSASKAGYGGINYYNLSTFGFDDFQDPAFVDKGTLISIELWSLEPSLLGSVSKFSLFGGTGSSTVLRYSGFREEIITNVNPDA